MDKPGPYVNEAIYKGIIGSLLYLDTNRPDIVFSIDMCARLQTCPKESHLNSTKRILKYIKGTIDLVIFYAAGDIFNLVGYANAEEHFKNGLFSRIILDLLRYQEIEFNGSLKNKG